MRYGPSRVLGFGLIVAALAGHALGADDDAPPIGRGLGQPVPSFALTNVRTGKPLDLSHDGGAKATVVVFLGTDCPVGNLYLPRLNELSAAWASQGVALWGINSNASESAEAVAEHARKFELAFPVLRDPDGKVASSLQALRTCEALVIDSKSVLRYRGAIDDQYQVGLRRERAESRPYLADAVDAVLGGREPETPSTSVDGCPIERDKDLASGRKPLDRVRPPSAEIVAAYEQIEGAELPEVGDVTYAHDVAPIVQARCQSCHRPGQVGPFSLLTFEDARRWGSGIHEVVDNRRMPPWHADPRHGSFSNDRHLPPRERATLLAWVEDGCPSGDLTQAPPNPTFAEGWSIGQPDQVFAIPAPYTVPAEGVVAYQRFRVKTGFTEDKWIQAAEARPGDWRTVHHIIVYMLDPSAADDSKKLSHLCGYAPGDMPSRFPEGIAKRIPAGAELIFELHYTPNGKMTIDRSAVGFVYASKSPEREAITRGIANNKFEIAPGDGNSEVRSSITVRQDSVLLSFMPHMHLRGKDFKYTATFPDGTSEVLLSVPAYDFNWQSYYTLAEPRKLPKGTRIDCVAHFDNSSANPANPDPTATVHWGDQTWEEMMIGYVDYVIDAPIAPRQATAEPASSGQLLGKLLLKRFQQKAAQQGRARAATGSDRP
jgi:peroxiredoxin